MLCSDDYMKYSNYLEKGKNLLHHGAFKQRYNKGEFEFTIERITLLENIKQHLTRQLIIDVQARQLNDGILRFIEENVKKFPGKRH